MVLLLWWTDFLVLGPAPLALSLLLDRPAANDGIAQALVGLGGSDIVDAGVVVTMVVPVEVFLEVSGGLAVSRKRPGYSGARFAVLKADSMKGLSSGVRGRANNRGMA